MKGIVWLASYPKSGNTWFRVFLNNLLAGGDEPADINDLKIAPIASARDIFDDGIGIEASDLSAEEIDLLRPRLYSHLAEETEGPLFMKIHDAYTLVADNTPLIPEKATAGALYFIRNPLDVAVSFAHHIGCDYDTSITYIARDDRFFCGEPGRLHVQLRQRLLSWSGHVESWMDHPPFPVCLIRYEDMKLRTLETFTNAVRFAGLPHVHEQIRKALDFSSFDNVQKQECAEGFREKNPASVRFFRKGEIGSWREELTDGQAARVVRDHCKVMRRFGYLDGNGDPVY
ncbi:MAG TPA: sulfotransferase domain-containing protein [Desulfuromonadaceae bacterium]